MLKSEAIDDLVDAVRAALEGDRFASSAVAPRGLGAGLRSAELDKSALSNREQEVLCLLAESWRTKEIAKKLGISPKTVETYRARIMLKLGIDNLPGLVKFAIRAGITSSER